MLFNSNLFLFLFLPITLGLFFCVAKVSQKFALSVLLIASVIFYGWSDYHFVIILALSIVMNFAVGNSVSRVDIKFKKLVLGLGIFLNLALLSYFKYVNFFIQNINWLFGLHISLIKVLFPIGISFFTFTQIAFLIDNFHSRERYHFLPYSLFVTYFPHLIAGPIIHHKEVMPQFLKQQTYRFNDRNFLLGLIIFAIGLFKKTVLADSLSLYVDPVFDGNMSNINTIDAWIAALAYSFELYFDFSGYSDMAVGLSMLFNIKLPINFYSPYKATNIIEFWRRWNMTLSRFLKVYLYIPLGGNRKGSFRKYINLMITMLLGGLWHGADWMFVIWGLLHGLYLMLNHAWIILRVYLGINVHYFFMQCLAQFLTFLAVVVGWVFFRAPNLITAKIILKSMFVRLTYHAEYIDIKAFGYLIISMIIIWGLPNGYQFLRRYKPALIESRFKFSGQGLIVWRPTILWMSLVASIFVFGIVFSQESTTFLYFKF